MAKRSHLVLHFITSLLMILLYIISHTMSNNK
uniref:Uncharacterized protein n=1 Tax=Myoviridae sp. ct0wg9 TaxID=2826600 RepID=A0A8S5NH75_9CAUD|nr:MAG TPA: hypothetical protein [Myoviridae sp. ct0wg9]DAR75597.1 MAG TPA: hypothetical protein [Caudoviricetes sp.]